MASQHDRNFKELMKDRNVLEAFLKTYLPQELLIKTDWNSIEIYAGGGKHLEEKTQKKFESDFICFIRFNNEIHWIWFHCEHQSAHDPLMPLRIVNYQSAELLNYARQNPGEKLPTIITMIYHQSEKAWISSLDMKDLFADPELGMKYFGKPILIDLGAMSDLEIESHPGIGPIEMILKYIRGKKFSKRLRPLLTGLRGVGDSARKIMLKYIVQNANVSATELADAAQECLLPSDKEFIMTPAQQWMEQGREQGREQTIISVAKNLLAHHANDTLIAQSTGLDLKVIAQLKEEISH